MRKFIRFSFRSFLILLVAVCLFGGYLANQAHQQRKAVAQIRELGGTVTYDWQDINIPRRLADPYHYETFESLGPPGPTWLREWVGDEYFQTVKEITFINVKELPDDAFTNVIAGVKDVDSLYFANTAVNDQHLVDLGKLSKLKRVYLIGTLVSEKGLDNLSNPDDIEELVHK